MAALEIATEKESEGKKAPNREPERARESRSLANTIGGFSNLRAVRFSPRRGHRGFLIGQISPEFACTHARPSSPRVFSASPTRNIGLVKIPGGNEIEISGL